MVDIIQTVYDLPKKVTFDARTPVAKEWMNTEGYGDPCTFKMPEEADGAWEFREKARGAGLKIVRSSL